MSETSKQWKQVKGVDVVSVEAAPTPLGGGRVYLKAVQLNLADGTVMFGCAWPECYYTFENPTTIATGHWKAHEVTPDLRRVPFKDWTLEQILGRLTDSEADLKKVMAQRDKAIEAMAPLKARIKELEGQLVEWNRVKKAFGKS
jgi:hypothetical protein